jgi:hypothetical protein
MHKLIVIFRVLMTLHQPSRLSTHKYRDNTQDNRLLQLVAGTSAAILIMTMMIVPMG